MLIQLVLKDNFMVRNDFNLFSPGLGPDIAVKLELGLGFGEKYKISKACLKLYIQEFFKQ
jgi:hypothetical protein